MFCLSLPCATVLAQSEEIIPDTSFTIYSNYIKLRKHHPFVEPIVASLPDGVQEHSNVVYKRIGERSLHLDIFCPAARTEKVLPGVLLIHGGGWSSGSKAHLVPMAQQLAGHGYVAASVEYRLSPEAKFPAAVLDLQAAIRWLKANSGEYHLDTSRIAVLGCSAGAQLASLIGVIGHQEVFVDTSLPEGCSSKVHAVVNVDGIVSFIHPEADAEGEAASKWLGGTRETARDNWRAASPLEYADEHTPPFLFINSSVPRFHAGRDDFIEILKAHNTAYEVHTIPETQHGFWLVRPWFAPTVEFTLEFLNAIFRGSPQGN
jgi:pectinesterase